MIAGSEKARQIAVPVRARHIEHGAGHTDHEAMGSRTAGRACIRIENRDHRARYGRTRRRSASEPPHSAPCAIPIYLERAAFSVLKTAKIPKGIGDSVDYCRACRISRYHQRLFRRKSDIPPLKVSVSGG
uniref:Uncharacterized protein n=1 Tax=Candidatus Kentrum eta TaxID=2126337 RepID=A0A450V258_9GAMM|nr:MAG: hypothetical protein BECKH772A_GA0070896_100289 [Candidatus Kentron sp. H]VFJ92204.1 MAG: hypothetical protein BECKH772B_GA0070898_100269 [Candidatus Kentron sp. H]VFJ98873.1 MAG: hypothetical protein BECKH772C_GA0070978_100269 [Candidatus Kentron sp. H]